MDNQQTIKTEEEKRLDEANSGTSAWRQWGPYLSERQWGTVREDYSPKGTAWEYFPHDHARSRAYRWGEDGIAGISDEKQQLCFAIALWNGKDPILKERLYGLTNNEGNHGEDVKEYYFYLDNVPSHAYMKYLYKYPQSAYPYENLLNTNKKRNRYEPEYELLDTGIFNDDRYYDLFVEYAKGGPEEILIQLSIANRGPDTATLHLLPHLWFRNTWSWELDAQKPTILLGNKIGDTQLLEASHRVLGDFWLYCETPNAVLFTENETNNEKLFSTPNATPYVKDGINDFLIQGKTQAVNPNHQGTKAAVHYRLEIQSGETRVVKLRLSRSEVLSDPFTQTFDDLFTERKNEADQFYQRITPFPISDEMRAVQRQAFAGLLWNKQCYHYNIRKWLDGDPKGPKPPEERKEGRNADWKNLDAFDVISVPDKWEFPWFAAWDLSFHSMSLALIDPEFAKSQLILLTREWYMAPQGALPAYEWGFNDVNPPMQVWAALHIYQLEKSMYGRNDRQFLERIFQKLVINFTWWVNQKDVTGRNVFEGGFLGLDNIGAMDRTKGPPHGDFIEQRDGTGWMGMYCLKMLEIALELSSEDSVYEDMATKFFEHFVAIADAINGVAKKLDGLWDEKNGFYYSLLITADGDHVRICQNTLSGIIPLFAVAVSESEEISPSKNYKKHFRWFVRNREKMLHTIANFHNDDGNQKTLLAFANNEKLRSILKKILDQEEFLSPYGVRSVSKKYAQHPFILDLGKKKYKLDYEPAETTTNFLGGNSNWRGPIWFPLNYLLIESLKKFYYFYDDEFKVEFPVGSGQMANLWEISNGLSERLIHIFLKDENGRRPIYGDTEKFQNDPYWRDYLLFHEYFNGDNGAGLGASNQTGWTGLVVNLIHQHGEFLALNQPPHLLTKESFNVV